MLSDIDIVLINTSHPGNIGAAARAMKTMGFKQLVLVAPRYFPHTEAEALAASAVDVLQQARIVSNLDEALKGITTVIGTSARLRDLAAPLLTARECGTWLIHNRVGRTAILFGEERTGLTNEALDRCHAYVHINTADEYSSLNLAQAVQIIAYELRLALLSMPKTENNPGEVLLSDDTAMEGYFQHLERLMVAIEFLDPQFPKRLMPRLRRLYHRARPEVQELNILRGILTAVEKKIGNE